MKVLVFILLIGFAAARFVDVSDDLRSFAEEFDDEDDPSIRDEIIKRLKKNFESICEHIKGALEKGNRIRLAMLVELKHSVEKLRESGDKVEEYIKEKVKDFVEKATGALKATLKNLGLIKDDTDKRDTSEKRKGFKEKLGHVLNKINEGESIEKLKEFITNSFKEGSALLELLLETLKKGINRLKDTVNQMLNED